jgi:hypothetical protein
VGEPGSGSCPEASHRVSVVEPSGIQRIRPCRIVNIGSSEMRREIATRKC